jgi:hypothetical protein
VKPPAMSQIQTGFALLARRGTLRLAQRILRIDYSRPDQPGHLRRARRDHMRVDIAAGPRLYFDAHDGPEIDEEAAAECDCYFKRTFIPRAIPERLQTKVVPMGMNYEVYTSGFDRFEAARTMLLQGEIGGRIRGTVGYGLRSLGFELGPRVRQPADTFCAAPMPEAEPRVLFITRTYDPGELRYFSEEKAAERVRVNEMRAQCIRGLRKALGPSFYGGLQSSAFSARNFPDALLDDSSHEAQKNYLQLMRVFPVCIATRGLHGSVGWKMAEYVAFSKAIVTEQTDCGSPGSFVEPSNYLEFSTVDQCIEKAVRLTEDRDLRAQQMRNNWEYFNAYLRPDAMVSRAIDIALANSAAATASPRSSA